MAWEWAHMSYARYAVHFVKSNNKTDSTHNNNNIKSS